MVFFDSCFSISIQKNNSRCYCYLSPAGVSSLIVGGKDAPDGLAPYQCSLQGKSGSGRYHICGCVIISAKWILTAAHCVESAPSNYVVLVGTNDLNSGGFVYEAERIIKHEDYQGYSIGRSSGGFSTAHIESNKFCITLSLDETQVRLHMSHY